MESDTQRKRFKRQKDIDRTDEVFRECDAFKAGIVEYGFRLGLTQNNYVTSCKWSSESRYLVTSSQDRNARIFELDENNKKVCEFFEPLFLLQTCSKSLCETPNEEQSE